MQKKKKKKKKKKFYSSQCFSKYQIFSLFPIVKMNTNSAEICRVGYLEADFQQVLLVHFFLKFSPYCYETSINQIQQRKVKQYFLRQKFKKITFL